MMRSRNDIRNQLYGWKKPPTDFLEKLSSPTSFAVRRFGSLGVPVERPISTRRYCVIPAKMQVNTVLMSCQFCPSTSQAHLLALCTEDGHISIMDTRYQEQMNKPILYLKAHLNAVMDICWLPSNTDRMISCSGDESCVLWDLKTKRNLQTFRGHSATVRCIDSCPQDQNLFVSGSRDGSICIWDVRSKARCSNMTQSTKPVNKISTAHAPMAVPKTQGHPFKVSQKATPKRRSNSRRISTGIDRTKTSPISDTSIPSITSVRYFDEITVLSASSSAQSGIRIWDLRKTYTNYKNAPMPKMTLQHPETGANRFGFSNLCVDRYGSSLFAVCTDNNIYEYSLINFNRKPVCQYVGAQVNSYYCRASVCPVDDYLICGSNDSSCCGSDDGACYIWQLNQRSHMKQKPIVRLDGHEDEVTAVSWSYDFSSIVSCDDNKWRLWSIDMIRNKYRTVDQTDDYETAHSCSQQFTAIKE